MSAPPTFSAGNTHRSCWEYQRRVLYVLVRAHCPSFPIASKTLSVSRSAGQAGATNAGGHAEGKNTAAGSGGGCVCVKKEMTGGGFAWRPRITTRDLLSLCLLLRETISIFFSLRGCPQGKITWIQFFVHDGGHSSTEDGGGMPHISLHVVALVFLPATARPPRVRAAP